MLPDSLSVDLDEIQTIKNDFLFDAFNKCYCNLRVAIASLDQSCRWLTVWMEGKRRRGKKRSVGDEM